MIYTWATVTDPGLVRDRNEDSVRPEGDGSTSEALIVAVADGMGGHVGGEIASATAMEAAFDTDDGPAARIAAANEAVVAAALKRRDLYGMGTTLTLGMLSESGDLHIGHVGDSRAYLLRDGEMEQITTDHSLVAEYIAAGQLTPEEAATHPRRNVITRALGTDWTVDVDEYEWTLEPGDRLLLCTDGLNSMVSDDEIRRIITENESVQAAGWALVEAANAAGGDDNITLIVVDVDE